MTAIFFTLTFLMLYLGMPIPAGPGGVHAALPPYTVTQAAAEETAKCPKDTFEQATKIMQERGVKYIIVTEPALSVLAGVIEEVSGKAKPEAIVKIVLIVPSNDIGGMPMASFDKNDCYLFGGSISADVANEFFTRLGKQADAEQE